MNPMAQLSPMYVTITVSSLFHIFKDLEWCQASFTLYTSLPLASRVILPLRLPTTHQEVLRGLLWPLPYNAEGASYQCPLLSPTRNTQPGMDTPCVNRTDFLALSIFPPFLPPFHQQVVVCGNRSRSNRILEISDYGL